MVYRYKRRPRKQYKKKAMFKRYRKYKNRARLTGYGPLSQHQIVKLRYYSYNEDLAIASGSTEADLWACNSMFDPDVTGSGHQPRGFDQWTLFYNHYTVIGAKVTVNFMCTEAEEVGDFKVGIATRATTTGETAESYIEHRNTKSRILNGGNDSKATVTAYFSAKKFFHRSPNGDPNLKAVFTANPTEMAYWHVFAFPINATTTETLHYDITIDYIAILSEPKSLAIS